MIQGTIAFVSLQWQLTQM